MKLRVLRAVRRGSRRLCSEPGFTLVELMVVVAIISILASVALPMYSTFRQKSKLSTVIKAMHGIVAAQESFWNQDPEGDGPDFASSFAELNRFSNLIPGEGFPEEWAVGNVDGYKFKMVAKLDTYIVRALPIAPGLSGFMSFYVDETGVVRYREGGSARPTDPPVPEGSDPPLNETGPDRFTGLAVAMIRALDKISGGAVVPAALNIVQNSANVLVVLAALDQNNDGKLQAFEIFGADPFSLAQEIRPLLSPFGLPIPDPSLGEDAALAKKLAPFMTRLTKKAKFDPSEVPLPAVPISEWDQDVSELTGLLSGLQQ